MSVVRCLGCEQAHGPGTFSAALELLGHLREPSTSPESAWTSAWGRVDDISSIRAADALRQLIYDPNVSLKVTEACIDACMRIPWVVHCVIQTMNGAMGADLAEEEHGKAKSSRIGAGEAKRVGRWVEGALVIIRPLPPTHRQPVQAAMPQPLSSPTPAASIILMYSQGLNASRLHCRGGISLLSY